MSKKISTLSFLNDRSREIFRLLVDSYLETGEPVGSKTLASMMNYSLSPASIRSVLSDLEKSGLLISPHISAGRFPSPYGMRLFVDSLLEVGALKEQERQAIKDHCQSSGIGPDAVLTQASTMLSGLSKYAGIVFAPNTETPLKHIEFVPLGENRALVVMVTADNRVENRILTLPEGTLPSTLIEASNYLNDRLRGHTLNDAVARIRLEKKEDRQRLNETASRLVDKGLAAWTQTGKTSSLIVKGQANLLNNIQDIADLETLKRLFDVLETQESVEKLLSLTQSATGINIFIGAENALFSLSGMSMITAPYKNGKDEIIGALGIIGPTRMNYAKIIPLVDYTAEIVGKLIG